MLKIGYLPAIASYLSSGCSTLWSSNTMHLCNAGCEGTASPIINCNILSPAQSSHSIAVCTVYIRNFGLPHSYMHVYRALGDYWQASGFYNKDEIFKQLWVTFNYTQCMGFAKFYL